MDAKAQVHDLLQSSGAKLVRQKKHKIWILPDRTSYTLPSTPSDKRGWLNCLSDLRKRLGMKHEEKNQSDFDHQKKEAYEKPTEQHEEFLGDLPEQEDRPAVPISLSPLEQVKEPPERNLFTMYGRLPTAGIGKGRGRRTGSGTRCGEVYTYSPEVMRRASFLLQHEGEEASKKFLDDVKNGRSSKFNEQEPTAMSEQDNGATGGTRVLSSNGGLEDLIRQKRQEIHTWQLQIEHATVEKQRAEQVLESLQHALSLTTAPKSVIQNTQHPVLNTEAVSNGQKPRGHWRKVLEEVVGTNPYSLRKNMIVPAVLKEHPNIGTKGAVYQAMLGGLKNGWLFEDKDGFVRVKKEEASA